MRVDASHQPARARQHYEWPQFDDDHDDIDLDDTFERARRQACGWIGLGLDHVSRQRDLERGRHIGGAHLPATPCMDLADIGRVHIR